MKEKKKEIEKKKKEKKKEKFFRLLISKQKGLMGEIILQCTNGHPSDFAQIQIKIVGPKGMEDYSFPHSLSRSLLSLFSFFSRPLLLFFSSLSQEKKLR